MNGSSMKSDMLNQFSIQSCSTMCGSKEHSASRTNTGSYKVAANCASHYTIGTRWSFCPKLNSSHSVVLHFSIFSVLEEHFFQNYYSQNSFINFAVNSPFNFSFNFEVEGGGKKFEKMRLHKQIWVKFDTS